MTEFKKGIFNVIASTSAGRALVYTFGHVIIAMTVVSLLTGASLFISRKGNTDAYFSLFTQTFLLNTNLP